MKRLFAVAVAVLAIVPSARAQYYSPPPARPPAICAGSAFVDIVGTPGDDDLRAFSRATRVWGLAGNDRLTGSATRASCLLGGNGNDVLNLGAGGGVAHGNRGRDLVLGSGLGDVINPGRDADLVTSGAGDDKLSVRDGNAEIVDCGAGADQVRGDRVDLTIGCESRNLTGPPAVQPRPRPARPYNGDAVRFTLFPPRSAAAGVYRVQYLARCRAPVTVATLGRVRKERAVRVVARPPNQGWCRGRGRLAVIREPGYGLPTVPVARVSFAVR